MMVRTFVGSALAMSIATCPPALAGDLNPPAGAVAPTGKALTELEPRIALSAENTPGDANSVFEINGSGSYYLTDNLTVPAGFNGIEIESSRVTIDLNGFSINGQAQQGNVGITASQTKVNITVRNGYIASFLNSGIDLGNDSRVTIENVVVQDCGGNGVSTGPRGMLRNVLTRQNGNVGIRVGGGSHVIDCRVLANDMGGIEVTENDVLIQRCTVETNGGTGIAAQDRTRIFDTSVDASGADGIILGDDCVVRDSVVTNNGGDGLTTTNRASVKSVIASGNGTATTQNSAGIRLGGTGNVVRDSVAQNTNNGIGFILGSDALATNCLATGNGRTGFSGSTGVSLIDCRAEDNGWDGANISVRGTIEGGAYSFNGLNGIRIPTGVVRRTYVAKNEDAGIRLESAPTNDIRSGVRCENNTVAQNGQNGIQLISTGHFVVRNLLKGNSGDEIFGNLPASFVGATVSGPGTVNSGNSYANFTLLN